MGLTPFAYAVLKNKFVMAEVLLKFGEALKDIVLPSLGLTVFEYVIKQEYTNAIVYLNEKKAKIRNEHKQELDKILFKYLDPTNCADK